MKKFQIYVSISVLLWFDDYQAISLSRS